MDLEKELETVSSRQDLAAFIQSLMSDFEADPERWENNHLIAYLDGLGGWTQDMHGYFQNRGEQVPEQPSWRLIGLMLLAARYYE